MYYLYLAASSHLHRSSLNTPNPSLSFSLNITTSLLLGNYCSTELSKNTMKPTNFTSHKLLLLLLIFLGLIFVLLLSSFSTTTTTTIASRLLIPKTGHGDDIVVNIGEGFSQMNSVLEKGSLKDENLMGVEEDCGEEEECLKRRMISEAHLDYIYTQHQHQHP